MQQGQMGTPAYQPAFSTEGIDESRAWPASRDALSHQRDNLQRSIELNENGERVNFSFLLDSLGQRSSNGNHESTSPTGQRPPYISDELELPPAPWTVLTKLGPPTCPLDRILLDFLRSRQNESVGAGNVANPPSYPSVSSLLNPSGYGPADPLSQMMTDIISKFPHISELPNRAAVLMCMFSLMRWQIHPTQENYERMPEFLRPTPIQIYTSHPAWVDHIPWPRIREKVIANPHHYPFDNWFLPFTSGLSVNWPYDPVDCLLSTSEKDEPVMNPVFDRHLRRLENWSLGPLFAETYPELVDGTIIRAKESAVNAPSLKTSHTQGMPGAV
jgi:hypothetical protein